MDITLRQYEYKDYPQLLNLYREFSNSIRSINPFIAARKAESPEYYLTNALHECSKNKNSQFLLADYNDEIIGYAIGLIRNSQKNTEYGPYKYGVIWEIFVQEKYRKLGLGTRLVNAIEQHFKENNCKYSRLKVFGPNENALKLYSKLNYQHWEYNMIKEL